jgi:hypothetical protein
MVKSKPALKRAGRKGEESDDAVYIETKSFRYGYVPL